MTARHLALAFAVVVAVAIPVVAVPAGGAAGPEPTTQPPVVVEVSDRGFHWLDASVGAVAALAVVLFVVGLTLSVRHHNGEI